MEHKNPYTLEITNIKEDPIDSIDNLVIKTKQAFIKWGSLKINERVSILKKVIPNARKEEDALAKIVSKEMGKPIANASLEVKRLADYLEFYCNNAEEVLTDNKTKDGIVTYTPLGVVGIISPWNFPVGVPISGIIPALISGNSVIFKPSEYVIKTGQKIVEIFNDSEGFPKNLLSIFIGSKEHGKALVQSDINMIHFTGSTSAGKHIMAKAGEGIKRVLLELGGMDASIVCKDADIIKAAESLVENNCSNTGQVCCAVKRVYVVEDVYDEFVKKAKEISSTITYGNPEDEVKMGPLVAKFQQEKVHSIVTDAKEKGASILTGGFLPDDKPYFYPSTIILNATNEMKVLCEEPFGPVLPITKVKDYNEAIKLANDSKYGLMASVWTKDLELANKIARKLEAGTVCINKHKGPPLGSPFGGVKESGIGFVRSAEALKQFCNVKFIH